MTPDEVAAARIKLFCWAVLSTALFFGTDALSIPLSAVLFFVMFSKKELEGAEEWCT